MKKGRGSCLSGGTKWPARLRERRTDTGFPQRPQNKSQPPTAAHQGCHLSPLPQIRPRRQKDAPPNPSPTFTPVHVVRASLCPPPWSTIPVGLSSQADHPGEADKLGPPWLLSSRRRPDAPGRVGPRPIHGCVPQGALRMVGAG